MKMTTTKEKTVQPQEVVGQAPKKLFYYNTTEVMYCPLTDMDANYGFTYNEQEAKALDTDYRLATLDDLEELQCYGTILEGQVIVAEGIFQYDADNTELNMDYGDWTPVGEELFLDAPKYMQIIA